MGWYRPPEKKLWSITEEEDTIFKPVLCCSAALVAVLGWIKLILSEYYRSILLMPFFRNYKSFILNLLLSLLGKY